MTARNSHHQPYVLPLVALLSMLTGAFFVALVGTTTTDAFAGSLGSLVGGFVGAGGAVLAVFLTMDRQRIEEEAKVASAVRIEVITFIKYIRGTIDVCINIKGNEVTIPRSDATYISKNLVAPVVYPAVADRLGLLPYPEATVGFYMRLAEAKAILQVLSKANPILPRNRSSAPDNVTPENAQSVVDCLATALELARYIIADDAPARNQLASMVRDETLQKIQKALAAAKQAFPEADTFRKAE